MKEGYNNSGHVMEDREESRLEGRMIGRESHLS